MHWTYHHTDDRNEKDKLHQPVKDEKDTADHFDSGLWSIHSFPRERDG